MNIVFVFVIFSILQLVITAHNIICFSHCSYLLSWRVLYSYPGSFILTFTREMAGEGVGGVRILPPLFYSLYCFLLLRRFAWYVPDQSEGIWLLFDVAKILALAVQFLRDSDKEFNYRRPILLVVDFYFLIHVMWGWKQVFDTCQFYSNGTESSENEKKQHVQ